MASDFGKFRPWLLRAAPLLAITSIVFWTVPTLFDGYTMLVVLFFCKILYEGCYTMFNIPILVRVIQQALEDVLQAQRDACLAMGLTRWEATLHILIPEAMPAIVTGIVLSAGRVFGEATALLFTSGMSSPVRLNFLSFNLSSPTCAWNVFRPGESLAVHIYKIYGEGSPEAQQIVWGTAALLMICVLLFNVVARIVGKQLARRMTAE